MVGTLIGDADGIYDPRAYNDRLLLGLRGMLSEAELHLLRLRLEAGRCGRSNAACIVSSFPLVRRGCRMKGGVAWGSKAHAARWQASCPTPPMNRGETTKPTSITLEACGRRVVCDGGGKNKHEDICASLELFAAKVMSEFHAEKEDRQRQKMAALAPYIEAAFQRKQYLAPLADDRAIVGD